MGPVGDINVPPRSIHACTGWFVAIISLVAKLEKALTNFFLYVDDSFFQILRFLRYFIKFVKYTRNDVRVLLVFYIISFMKFELKYLVNNDFLDTSKLILFSEEYQ